MIPAIDSLVFVGFNRQVAALDRKTGELRWQWSAEKGRGFVALLLDVDRLFASIDGYTYCLDPLTGRQLWFNPLSGFGTGTPCLATLNGNTLLNSAAEEERRRSDDDTAHAATTTQ